MATEEGQVIGCHTVEAWNELLQKGNESKKLVIYLFIQLFDHESYIIFVIMSYFLNL